MDDPEEMAHFKQVVGAFFNYTVKWSEYIIYSLMQCEISREWKEILIG
jgi:hypothetical protein